MALVGYVRVSSLAQETRLQRDALKRAGVRKLFEEKASAVSDRPVLRACIASLRPGDVLVVWKLDRLARSLRDLLALIEGLDAMGCQFRSLTEPVDTSSALGEFVLQILGAIAQFERRLIRERAIAGQVAAWNRGVRWGGEVRVLSDEDGLEVALLKRHYSRVFTVRLIAEIFDCSPATVWRYYWLHFKPTAAKLKPRLPVLSAYGVEP